MLPVEVSDMVEGKDGVIDTITARVNGTAAAPLPSVSIDGLPTRPQRTQRSPNDTNPVLYRAWSVRSQQRSNSGAKGSEDLSFVILEYLDWKVDPARAHSDLNNKLSCSFLARPIR